MYIDKYPKFRQIDISDAEMFKKAFEDNPPAISEFTFTNLYAWRSSYKLTISLMDNLLILCSESLAQKRFFNPIGKGDIKTVIEKIINDVQGVFIRIPEKTKILFDDEGRLSAELDADNSDYLYNTSDLVNLRGRRYDGKRNLIKKFKSAYSYEYMRLDQLHAKECLSFEDAWCAVKECDNIEGLNNERSAIREMINNFSLLGIIGGAIKINNRVYAIAIGEKLNPETLVMHIMKADSNVPGLYQTMMNEFLQREGAVFKYVNLEQDLGIQGLRKTKLSYHPAGMVKKYTVKKIDT